MKKFILLAGDVAVTVGSCIGVGMLSGKEAQIFFGNKLNVAVFAAVFFICNAAFRSMCVKTKSSSITDLTKNCFGKIYGAFNVCLLTCSFVCIVTMLAGAQQCLATLIPLGNFPFYSVFAAAASAVLLKKGIKALKPVNAASIVLAIIFLAILLSRPNTYSKTNTPAYMPTVYALFSVTASLGVISEMACEKSVKENLLCSFVSAAALAVVMLLILPICDFSQNLPSLGEVQSPLMKAFAAFVILLASVTGLAANAYPIDCAIKDVIDDDTLRSAAIFTAALAFSAFGFDFAVKFGYALVSAVGVIMLAAGTKIYKKRKRFSRLRS